MDKLIKRHIESISYGMNNFPVIALLGARQVGKTTLLHNFAKGKRVFDLEREVDFQLINDDPEFFFSTVNTPIFIDEAQLSPKLFKALRVFVDKNRSQVFQVMISDSSSPELLENISESLAGRVAIIEIGTLNISESEKHPPSPLYQLISTGKFDEFQKLRITKRQWSEKIWWGGYPEPFVRNDKKFKNVWSENYIKTYLDRDIRRLFPDLNMEADKTFIRMLAHSSGEIINYAEWSSSLGISEPTVKKYLTITEGTFLFRKIPAYSFHSTKRLIKSPKGYLRDTGLLCALLRIEEPQDLIGHPRAGPIFESFCIEQIIKSLTQNDTCFEYSFWRTKTQQEVDLVLEFPKFKIPVEIKLGVEIRKENLNSLKSFIEEYNSPFGILINNSTEVAEVSPRIFQIPFGAL